MGDAIIFHGVCDHIGTGAHLRQSIAHSHTDTGQLQHFQIVVGISKGNGFLRGDTDCRTQGTMPFSLPPVRLIRSTTASPQRFVRQWGICRSSSSSSSSFTKGMT